MFGPSTFEMRERCVGRRHPITFVPQRGAPRRGVFSPTPLPSEASALAADEIPEALPLVGHDSDEEC